MWHILKAEARYHSWILIGGVFALLILYMVEFLDPDGNPANSIIIAGMAVLGFIYTKAQKERRLRRLLPLAVPLRQIALLRALPIFIIHSLVSFLCLLHLVSESDPVRIERFWSRFTIVGGLLLVLFLLSLILSDVTHFRRKQPRYLVSGIMIGAVALAVGLLFSLKLVWPKNVVLDFVYLAIHSIAGIGLIYLLGFGLTLGGIRTFGRRTSYLE